MAPDDGAARVDERLPLGRVVDDVVVGLVGLAGILGGAPAGGEGAEEEQGRPHAGRGGSNASAHRPGRISRIVRPARRRGRRVEGMPRRDGRSPRRHVLARAPVVLVAGARSPTSTSARSGSRSRRSALDRPRRSPRRGAPHLLPFLVQEQATWASWCHFLRREDRLRRDGDGRQGGGARIPAKSIGHSAAADHPFRPRRSPGARRRWVGLLRRLPAAATARAAPRREPHRGAGRGAASSLETVAHGRGMRPASAFTMIGIPSFPTGTK